MINSCNKGKTGERECANYFKSHGLDAQRNPDQDAHGLTDVSASLLDILKLAVEVKRPKTLPKFNESALAQAEKAAKPDEIPLVMSRENRGEWKVYMKADHLMRILEMIRNRDVWS